MIFQNPVKSTKNSYNTDKPSIKYQMFFVFTSNIFSTLSSQTPPILLDNDNVSPGVNVHTVKSRDDKIFFLCQIDTCAVISTGNLLLHKWIITRYTIFYV